jgi:hypothetical protein
MKTPADYSAGVKDFGASLLPAAASAAAGQLATASAATRQLAATSATTESADHQHGSS